MIWRPLKMQHREKLNQRAAHWRNSKTAQKTISINATLAKVALFALIVLKFAMLHMILHMKASKINIFVNAQRDCQDNANGRNLRIK